MTRPIVLVHGAWHGDWCFQSVVESLRDRRFDVHTVNLPLHGVDADIATARACIEQYPGAVVLGHSYGGLVITHAAVGLDVAHLVYLAALMPEQGEDVGAKIARAPQASALNDALVMHDDGLVSIDPALGAEAFYHDCDPQGARDALSRLRPQRLGVFPVLDQPPPWRSVRSTYVICRDDRALHPELQRDFSARSSHVVEWEGGHSPFLAHPERVVELLTRLAD